MPAIPEIIPPRKLSRPGGPTDEQLDQLATLLDDVFCVPGTRIRFGLDALIGLIPGLGDIITGAMSFLILYAAWQRGLPRVTQTRMLANIAIDTLGGMLPVVGDIFDAWFKSNRMNYNLIMRGRAEPEHSHTWKDWLFLAGIAVCVAAIVAVPVLLVIWLVHLLS
jgi:hypothetical protein